MTGGRLPLSGRDPIKIVGHADVFSSGRVRGWALDLTDPTSSLRIDVFSSGDFISSHDANGHRTDLFGMGLQSVNHGFDFVCGLSAAAMSGIDLVARRNDTQPANVATNLAMSFIESDDLLLAGACRPDSSFVTRNKADAEATWSHSARTIGLDMDRVFRDAVSGSPLTVIAPSDVKAAPFLAPPHAVFIEVPVTPAGVLERITALASDQRGIVVDRLLQHDVDCRLILGAAFDKLQVGGHLVVVVPSQILYERKLQLPSRLPSKFGKFYTPSLLVTELEEAIDPFLYRLRFAGDLDENYVDIGLDQAPSGRSDVLVIIEKVAPPAWLDRLQREDNPTHLSPIPTEKLKPIPHSPYIVVSPDTEPLGQILLLQLDHRGDFMMGSEARRLIREAWPDAHITLICGSWNKQDALQSRLADTVVTFDFYAEDKSAGIPSVSFDQYATLFARLVERQQFDVAVDLRLGDDTRPLLKHVSARTKAGFDTGDEFPWLDIRLPTINPEQASKAWQRFVPACDFHTSGEHTYLDMKVSSEDCERSQGGLVVWGPYTDLPFGRYEFILKCSSAVQTEIKYDITAYSGVTTLGGGTLKVGPRCDQMMQVRLPHAVQGVELRIYSIPGRPYPPLVFGGLQIIKRASLAGVHQRENMNLLAYLVTLRLKQAAATEEIARHVAG